MPAPGDIVVLCLFGLLPSLAAWAVFVFFFRHRQHKREVHWSRLLAGNLLVFLLAASSAVLGGELYYRFFYDTTESFGLTKATARWFQRHFQDNNIGFRDSVDYDRDIPTGRRRVTFMGDSFTVGHGIADVEDRFANRLRAARSDLDVHVMANAGWDTGAELWNVHSLAASGYQMDVVILVYCLNDVADLVPEWEQITDRIFESSQPGYLVQHSYLLNTWYYRWKAQQDPDVANYYEFVREKYEGRVWQRQQQRLATLQDAVERAGGRLLVVTFPFLHALGAEYRYAEVHRRLDQFWQERGVAHLDLLDVFESRTPREVTVNRYDAHPNEEAHAVAAEAMLAFLERELGQPEQ